jgi:hypothetical protein
MASEDGPSDWLARLNNEEVVQYIGNDDNSGGLPDVVALSPEHCDGIVFSPEIRDGGVEDFPESGKHHPWYAPDTYAEDTEVPDSLLDLQGDILAGESQPPDSDEQIEREVEAAMAAYELAQGKAEEDQGNVEEDQSEDVQLNFGVELDPEELQVVKDTLKNLLPTYRP